MDHIIKIVESLEKLVLLIGGASETGKHEIRKQQVGFLPAMIAPMVTSLIAPMVYGVFITATCSFFIDKCYNWKRSHQSRKEQEGGILPLLALPLMMKVLYIKHIVKKKVAPL